MKIIIDNAVPFVEGVFEPYTTVVRLPAKAIDRDAVKDATALLIRTRTKCNRALLEGSTVRHIATATIGFDHIDTQWCSANGIEVSRAAGCNARGVLQWVGGVLSAAAKSGKWQPHQKRLGVVGVGSVGSLIEQYAKAWGFEVLCCDPPRKEREGGDFVDFETICSRCDIITLHTPLDATTHHLISKESLSLMNKECIIINSSRGEVVDTKALLEAPNPCILDVWECEPQINRELLNKTLYATPHIAGYSIQGKSNASTMAVRSIAKALEIKELMQWQAPTPPTTPQPIEWKEMCSRTEQYFPLEEQSARLKAELQLFEEMRSEYPLRDEFY